MFVFGYALVGWPCVVWLQAAGALGSLIIPKEASASRLLLLLLSLLLLASLVPLFSRWRCCTLQIRERRRGEGRRKVGSGLAIGGLRLHLRLLVVQLRLPCCESERRSGRPGGLGAYRRPRALGVLVAVAVAIIAIGRHGTGSGSGRLVEVQRLQIRPVRHGVFCCIGTPCWLAAASLGLKQPTPPGSVWRCSPQSTTQHRT